MHSWSGAARLSSNSSRSTAACRRPIPRRALETRVWHPAVAAVCRAAIDIACGSESADTPDDVSRSGRPTSPTNKVSPVSRPYGTASSGCSYTTTHIDSGVWPGVARISSVTSPSDSRWPSLRGSIGNCTSAPSQYEMTAPVAAASSSRSHRFRAKSRLRRSEPWSRDL